jgi:two-component sensor histidine kinase/PAS domain-containing protein
VSFAYSELTPKQRTIGRAAADARGSHGLGGRGQEGRAPKPRRLATIYVLICLALTLPAGMLGLSVLMAWQSLWQNAEERAVAASEGAAEYAGRVLASYMATTDRIALATRDVSEAEITANEPRWHRQLHEHVARMQLILEAKLVGADGTILAAAASSPPPNFSMAVREQFTALERIPPGSLWISRAYQTAGGDKNFFSISRGRPGPDGGAVVVSLDVAALGAGLARVSIRNGEIVAILRRDGEVLTRHPPMPGRAGPLPTEAPLRKAMDSGRESGTLQGILPMTGEPVLVGYRRLADYPQLYAVAVTPHALIMRQWWHQVWHVLGFGLLAMAALGALAWRVARQQASLLGAKAELEARVAQRSAQLADEGQRLALALDAGDLGTWEMDLERGMIWRSARMRRILGVPEEPAVTHYPGSYPEIHPDDMPLLVARHQDVLSGDAEKFHVEARFRSPSGGWGWLESFGRVVRRDPDTGAAQLLTGVTRDITARKDAEARREVMIGELDHRARNILAVIQSILRLSAKEDPARYASRVEGRIAALSRAQGLLSADGWSGADLADVLRGEVLAFIETGGPGDAARFSLDGPGLRLTAQAVQPVTLAIHELASNARDHGAFSVPGGRVAISWWMDKEAGLLRLRWQEAGGPPAKAPERWAVGGKMIRASIQSQLHGSFSPEWGEAGFAAEITLPMICLAHQGA